MSVGAGIAWDFFALYLRLTIPDPNVTLLCHLLVLCFVLSEPEE